MTKELLIKFLENRCTPDELNDVLQWINKNALSDHSKSLAYDDWTSFEAAGNDSENDEKFGLLLDKIHHKINISRRENGSSGKTIPRITAWLTRAAAILLVPVLTFSIYMLSTNHFQLSGYADRVVDSLEIIAPVGSRTVVQLADGTEVFLNSGSKIKYPKSFKGNTRELALTGEGYFDVAHNPDKPFIVKAKGLHVKALGTQFNVQAYPDEDEVGTTLIEGKVVLDELVEGGTVKTIGSLVPGQHVDYNVHTGKISSTQGDVEKYVAWKDGRLVFDNTGIQEVAAKLGRIFNVDIEIADEIKDLTYSVTFTDEPLLQMLDMMTVATPVDFKVIPRQQLPDGTFSKQKILFKKKSK